MIFSMREQSIAFLKETRQRTRVANPAKLYFNRKYPTLTADEG